MKKISLIFLLLTAVFNSIFAQVSIANLRADYQVKPLGIDISKPHFSWEMKALDAKRGYSQKVYQIVVKDSKNQVVWDSKKVNSDISNGIEYAGAALKATTRYVWKVTVWDNFNKVSANNSWFETGLMNPNPDLSAWSGAKWIGGGDDDLVLYAQYLSVFKFQYGIQLDKASNSTKAAFVFGANDKRLMDKDLNIMGVENAPNQSYVSFEIDISKVSDAADGLAKFNIYRVGYTKTDKADMPFKSLEIPQKIINNANKYEKHTVFVECNFGLFEIFIDGTGKENLIKEKGEANPSPFAPRGINLNPVGSGNNFISFPMLADIGFHVADNQTAHFSDVLIKNFRFPSNTLFTENLNTDTYNGIFKSNNLTVKNGIYSINGISRNNREGGGLIVANPSKNAAPMLRTTFTTQSKPIKTARLYVTARGIYEMYLNGNRVSNEYFNPGLTQYNKNHMYQTFDVTSALKQGENGTSRGNRENALGAWLSEGWWSGNITYSGESWNYFGDRQSLLSKLVITYGATLFTRKIH